MASTPAIAALEAAGIDHVVHRYTHDRRHADYRFRRQMQRDGVSLLRRWIMWAAVRMSAILQGKGGAGWGKDVPGALALLVLDEVFGSLDEQRRQSVVDLLARLRDRFPQVIMISHIEGLHDSFDRVVRVSYDPETRTSKVTEDSPEPIDAALGGEIVFIVGQPRSGSTLFEQILAAHPDVEGAGELSDAEADALSAIGRLSARLLGLDD